MLTLTGASTYNGGTQVSAGTLQVQASNVLSSGAVNVAAGGTFWIYSPSTTAPTFSNVLTGAGTVSLSSFTTAGGNVIPTFSSSATGFTGTVAVNTSEPYFFPSFGAAGSTTLDLSNATLVVSGLNYNGQPSSFVYTNMTNGTIKVGELDGNGALGSQFGAGTTTWQVGSLNTNSTFSGVISNNWLSGDAGAAVLTKVGSGTLTLTGSGLYTGGTTISGGTLQVGAGGASGSIGSGTVVNNATLVFNRSDGGLAVPGAISGSGAVFQNGSGTTTLGGAGSYTGSTTINAGLLLATNGAAFGASPVTLNGGALGVSGVTATNSITLNGGALFAAGSGALSGSLGGTGGLTKIGGGVLTLSGTNTYSGPTVVNAGTLRVAGTPILPAGMTIMPVGDSITYGTNGQYAGYRGYLYSDLVASGNTSFQFVGTTNGNPGGTVGTLPASPVDQTWHDGWPGWRTDQIDSNMSGWLTSLSGSSHLPSVVTMMIGTNDVNQGYSVSWGTSHVASIINTVCTQDPGVRFLLANVIPEASGNTTQNAWITSYNADLPAVVAAANAAGDNVSLVNLNTNFPSGGLGGDGVHPNETGYSWMASQWYNAIMAGATTLPATSALPLNTPTTVAAGATLDLDGTPATIGPLNGGGNLLMGNSGGLTVNSSYNSTFSGAISGPSGLTKIGPSTLTLSGPNTYSGATTISAGRLALGAGGSIAATPTVTIAAGASFDVTALPGGYNVPSGQTITGGGTVSMAAGTALTLGSGAALAAPAAGVGALTVNGGTLVLNTGSALSFSASASDTNSQIAVTGALDLAGSGIAVSLYQAGTSSLYTTDGAYTLMTYGSLVGSTNNLLSYSPVNLSKSYSFNATSGSLTLTIGDTPIWAGTSSQNWSDPLNWSTSAAPVAGQALVFAGTNTANSNDLNGFQAGGLQFNAGAGAFNLAGGSIQIIGALNNLSANPQTVGLNIVLGGNLPINAASPITISGVLSDGGAGYGITLTGSSTVVLAAANTFGGTTTISGGTLELGSGAANGSVAGNIVNNAALVFAPATTATLSGAISGPGSVTQAGPGNMVLAGNNSYSGATIVSGGTLSVLAGGAVNGTSGVTVQAGGVLSVPGGTLATTGTTIVNGGTINVVGGLIGSTGGIVAQSAGSFNLSGGTIASPGAVTASGGTVNLSGGLVSASSLTAQSGGLLGMSGGAIVTTAAATASGGTINLAGGQMNDTGNLITQAGGLFSLSNGTVSLPVNASGVFGPGYGATGIGTMTIGSGGVLAVGASNRTFIGGGPNGGPYGNGILNINAGGLVNIGPAGAFPNDLIYLAGYGGNGTINLSGGTLTSARTIQFGAGSGPVAVNFNGGTLVAGANINVVANAVMTTSIQDNGATINSNGFTVTVSSALTHGGVAATDGGLTKQGGGLLTLTGANTYNGGTTISAGTLQVAGAGTLGSGAVSIPGGSTLWVYTSQNGDNPTLGNVLTGAGTISLSSFTAATVNSVPTLSGSATGFSGTVAVNTSENYYFPALGGAGSTTMDFSNATLVVNGQNYASASGSFLYTYMTGGTIEVGELDGNGTLGANLNSSTTWQIGA